MHEGGIAPIFIKILAADGNTNKAQESRSSSSSGTLQALFAVSPGLLLLLLPRELVVFDLELGQPAGSTSLPPGRPVLSHLLGVFGSGVCQGGGDEGGLDFAYCTHVDGSLSVFVRVSRYRWQHRLDDCTWCTCMKSMYCRVKVASVVVVSILSVE